MKKKCNIHLKSRRNEPSERLIRRFIKKVKKEKPQKSNKPENSQKKKRCPNGTRKNKITGNCEPK